MRLFKSLFVLLITVLASSVAFAHAPTIKETKRHECPSVKKVLSVNTNFNVIAIGDYSYDHLAFTANDLYCIGSNEAVKENSCNNAVELISNEVVLSHPINAHYDPGLNGKAITTTLNGNSKSFEYFEVDFWRQV